MKRTVKVLALVLALIMAVTALAGCGKRLSGAYESTNDSGSVVLLAFDGKDFTYTMGSVQLKGTYEIKKNGDAYTFTMICDEEVTENGGAQKLDEPVTIYDKTPIRIGEDYITIGSGTSVRKYVKK